MIETQGLCKRFADFTAVDEVSLNVGKGEVLALLGPNGAGKTTTVRMLASVLRPSAGWARVAGFDVVERPADVRAAVGVLTENHGLYNRMPADDYLEFYGQIYGMSAEGRRRRKDELLEHFGLDKHRHRPVGEFSKGMRQKLALARSLLHDPPVLLLDEPTSAMDPESARLVRDAIHDLRSHERTLIICTHNLPEAEELADQIAIIRQGRIIAQGTPDELKDRLLGPPEFEARFACAAEGPLELPEPARVLERGPDWLRYHSPTPEQANPQVLRYLLGQGVEVVSLQEAPRNLEQVYLQAVQNADNGKKH
jgi:ABC-2 type transport system ATP-binding protein